MEFDGWALPAANAIASSLLINSGISKFVSPGPPRRALVEVAPAIDSQVAERILRVVAIAEVAVALALLLAPLRVMAAIAILALGIGFTLLGLLGILRHSKAPCGCFGASSRRPLGWLNVLLGVALAVTYPANSLLEAGEGYPVAALIATSIGSIVLCMYMRRELIIQLLWPRRSVPAESEAR